MPTYLQQSGYGAGSVGQMMFIASFGGLLGYWASGFLGDWLGTRMALIWTLLVSLVFVGLTFWVAGVGFAALAVSLFLVEFTSLGITGLLPKYIVEHFDTDVRAAGLGSTYNLGALAGGLSPVWGTALANSIGLGPAIGTLTAFWTLVVVAVLVLQLPKRALAAGRRWTTTADPAAPKPKVVTHG
jgi:SHS family sialic acid transporter-like MFS transporter